MAIVYQHIRKDNNQVFYVGGKKNIGKIPSNANSICVNKDNQNKYIKKQDLEDYVKLGWSLGGKPKKKKHE